MNQLCYIILFTEQVDVAVTHSTLVFGRYLVRILAGTQFILTEVLPCFPQFLQVNAGILYRLSHNRFLQILFQFISRRIARSYTVSALEVALCNPRRKPISLTSELPVLQVFFLFSLSLTLFCFTVLTNFFPHSFTVGAVF